MKRFLRIKGITKKVDGVNPSLSGNSVKEKVEFDVLLDLKYNPIHSFRDVNPYCIAFCYPITGSSFVLKGGWNDLEKALNVQRTPMFVHVSFWHKGKTRVLFKFYGFKGSDDFYINHGGGHERKMLRNSRNGQTIAAFRRVPRKWISQMDRFIK